MPEQIKIFKIIDGYRRGQLVDIIDSYKVTLLGSPPSIKYDLLGQTYSLNEIVEVESGEYPFKAYAPDTNYVPKEGTLVVNGANTYLDVSLQYKERFVVFTTRDTGGSNLIGVEVIVDSQIVGTTDAGGNLRVSLPIGTHTLFAKRDSGNERLVYVPQPMTIPEGPDDYTQTLIMGSIVDGPDGYVSVFSTPENASVYIDGAIQGSTTPMLAATFPEGLHTLRITKNGYVPYDTTFRIGRGETTAIEAKLTPAYVEGSVTFTTNTAGTEIYFDSTFVGIAPCTVRRPGGVYTYTTVNKNYYDTTGKVVIENGKNIQVDLSLELIPPPPPVVNPPAGTLLEYQCIGFDKYGKYADGNGGSLIGKTPVEYNSAFCGARLTQGVVIQTNADSVVSVYANLTLIATLGTVLDNNTQRYQTPVVDLTIGLTYNIEITPKPVNLAAVLLGAKQYEPKTSSYKVVRGADDARIPTPVYLPLTQIIYVERLAKLKFSFVEWSTNQSGDHTKGTGGLFVSGNKVIANASMLSDLWGPGDYLGDSQGTLSLTIIDPASGAIIDSKVQNNLNFFNPNISLTYVLPSGAKDINFKINEATRNFKLISSNSEDNAVTWTGPTTFNWITEAFQHLFYKDSGHIEVTVTIPYSYKG